VSGVIEGKGRSDVAQSLVGQEMTCRLCHEPHAAASPQLFTWQAKTQTELCIACHPK
jgi:predicted CXXCH cytochrome family protein